MMLLDHVRERREKDVAFNDITPDVRQAVNKYYGSCGHNTQNREGEKKVVYVSQQLTT